jgi:hypothetical protein
MTNRVTHAAKETVKWAVEAFICGGVGTLAVGHNLYRITWPAVKKGVDALGVMGERNLLIIGSVPFAVSKAFYFLALSLSSYSQWLRQHHKLTERTLAILSCALGVGAAATFQWVLAVPRMQAIFAFATGTVLALTIPYLAQVIWQKPEYNQNLPLPAKSLSREKQENLSHLPRETSSPTANQANEELKAQEDGDTSAYAKASLSTQATDQPLMISSPREEKIKEVVIPSSNETNLMISEEKSICVSSPSSIDDTHQPDVGSSLVSPSNIPPADEPSTATQASTKATAMPKEDKAAKKSSALKQAFKACSNAWQAIKPEIEPSSLEVEGFIKIFKISSNALKLLERVLEQDIDEHDLALQFLENYYSIQTDAEQIHARKKRETIFEECKGLLQIQYETLKKTIEIAMEDLKKLPQERDESLKSSNYQCLLTLSNLAMHCLDLIAIRHEIGLDHAQRLKDVATKKDPSKSLEQALLIENPLSSFKERFENYANALQEKNLHTPSITSASNLDDIKDLFDHYRSLLQLMAQIDAQNKRFKDHNAIFKKHFEDQKMGVFYFHFKKQLGVVQRTQANVQEAKTLSKEEEINVFDALFVEHMSKRTENLELMAKTERKNRHELENLRKKKPLDPRIATLEKQLKKCDENRKLIDLAKKGSEDGEPKAAQELMLLLSQQAFKDALQAFKARMNYVFAHEAEYRKRTNL